MKRYIVWNPEQTEGFITDSYMDAKYASGVSNIGMCPSVLAEKFRDLYADEPLSVQTFRAAETNSPAPSAAGDSTSMSASLNQQVETRDAVERGFQVADGWMPIESAPRDGTRILGYAYGWGRDIIFWSDEDQDCFTTGDRDRSSDLHVRFPATHWMPLPAPPAISDALGKV